MLGVMRERNSKRAPLPAGAQSPSASSEASDSSPAENPTEPAMETSTATNSSSDSSESEQAEATFDLSTPVHTGLMVMNPSPSSILDQELDEAANTPASPIRLVEDTSSRISPVSEAQHHRIETSDESTAGFDGGQGDSSNTYTSSSEDDDWESDAESQRERVKLRQIPDQDRYLICRALYSPCFVFMNNNEGVVPEDKRLRMLRSERHLFVALPDAYKSDKYQSQPSLPDRRVTASSGSLASLFHRHGRSHETRIVPTSPKSKKPLAVLGIENVSVETATGEAVTSQKEGKGKGKGKAVRTTEKKLSDLGTKVVDILHRSKRTHTVPAELTPTATATSGPSTPSKFRNITGVEISRPFPFPNPPLLFSPSYFPPKPIPHPARELSSGPNELSVDNQPDEAPPMTFTMSGALNNEIEQDAQPTAMKYFMRGALNEEMEQDTQAWFRQQAADALEHGRQQEDQVPSPRKPLEPRYSRGPLCPHHCPISERLLTAVLHHLVMVPLGKQLDYIRTITLPGTKRQVVLETPMISVFTEQARSVYAWIVPPEQFSKMYGGMLAAEGREYVDNGCEGCVLRQIFSRIQDLAMIHTIVSVYGALQKAKHREKVKCIAETLAAGIQAESTRPVDKGKGKATESPEPQHSSSEESEASTVTVRLGSKPSLGNLKLGGLFRKQHIASSKRAKVSGPKSVDTKKSKTKGKSLFTLVTKEEPAKDVGLSQSQHGVGDIQSPARSTDRGQSIKTPPMAKGKGKLSSSSSSTSSQGTLTPKRTPLPSTPKRARQSPRPKRTHPHSRIWVQSLLAHHPDTTRVPALSGSDYQIQEILRERRNALIGMTPSASDYARTIPDFSSNRSLTPPAPEWDPRESSEWEDYRSSTQEQEGPSAGSDMSATQDPVCDFNPLHFFSITNMPFV